MKLLRDLTPCRLGNKYKRFGKKLLHPITEHTETLVQ